MSGKVLLFHVSEEKADKIRELCHRMEIASVVVERSEYGQSLGALAGIMGFAMDKRKHTEAELPGEMLVFSGMPSETLDHFLAEYKKAEIPPVFLKAILTPHNIRWTPEELFEELLKEHRSMQ